MTFHFLRDRGGTAPAAVRNGATFLIPIFMNKTTMEGWLLRNGGRFEKRVVIDETDLPLAIHGLDRFIAPHRYSFVQIVRRHGDGEFYYTSWDEWMTPPAHAEG